MQMSQYNITDNVMDIRAAQRWRRWMGIFREIYTVCLKKTSP